MAAINIDNAMQTLNTMIAGLPPNLQPTVVRDHCIVPTVRFVAARDIEAGEELTFDYGALGSCSEEGDDVPGGNPHRGRTVCLCGETDYCRGFLPFNPS